MTNNKQRKIGYPKSEDDHGHCGISGNYFLEYALHLEVGGDYFSTIKGHHLIVMTRG